MQTPHTTLRVWDLPTRLFHWALVLCVAAAFVTVKLGGLWMDWHVRAGLAVFVLLVWRLAWGLVGPRFARFSQFVKGPATVLGYVRGRVRHIAGHNPLGACSVIALLAFFGLQAVTGLFANDDVMTQGPLAWLSDAWSSRLTGWHKLNQWIMIALVSLHVAAIAWYRWRHRQRLVGPMISGDVRLPKAVAADTAPASDGLAVRLGALALFLAIAAGTWWLTTLAPSLEFSY